MKAPINHRFAHSDGLTAIDLCKCDGSTKIVTGGSDGDLRVWTRPDDSEPAVVFSASDSCLTLVCRNSTVYAGTENNTVEKFSLPEGNPLGVLTKFTGAVNHVDISKSGNLLVAGSEDMTIQILKGENSYANPIKIEGHSAPILSIAVDPNDQFITSSSCDGTVCVWNVSGKLVQRWDDMFPSSNDITLSKTLCRIRWKNDGSSFGVPGTKGVTFFSRDDWKEVKFYTSPSNKVVSVINFSTCGKYLMGGCYDGTILIWNLETASLVYQHGETKDHITGLICRDCDLLAVDFKGRLISANISKLQDSRASSAQNFNMDEEFEDNDTQVEDGVVAPDDPFDDGLDDMLLDDEANEISISRIKAETGFLESEKEDIFVGVDKAKKLAGVENMDEDALSVSSIDSEKQKTEMYRPMAPIKIPFTDPQEPFQPSSSPEQLTHRFMAWNSIGIIRNYEVEDDETSAIDIEFHDVTFHNGIHLRNQAEYTIASLGKEAVCFGSPQTKDNLSKIMCLHFSSWDKNKEWSTELPPGEEVVGIAVGTGWICVATDNSRLRIFSTGGIQRNVIDIAGPIIAVAAHEDLLFITFNFGVGLHENHSIFFSVYRIRTSMGVFPLIPSEPLPLSPKSFLTWVGFSDEGIPAYSDSSEWARILHGRTWLPFLNMKEGSKGESDHYWVTGLSIFSQNVRAVRCKGNRYPSALPRPTILLLNAKISLCEPDSKKSQMEDTLLRSSLLISTTKKMDRKGFDIEDYKENADKDLKETLMKLFALCCEEGKELRASEYAAIMPTSHTIQVALKLANRLRKIALIDRLTAIGRKKLDEEEEGVEEDDDDFENLRVGNVIYSSLYSSIGNSNSDNRDITSNPGTSSNNVAVNNSNDFVILEENPLLSRQRADIQASVSSSYKNPFKRGSTTNKDTLQMGGEKSTDMDGGKGLALIDVWKRPLDKPSLEFNPKKGKGAKAKEQQVKEKQSSKDKSKIQAKEAKTKAKSKQKTLFEMKSNPGTAQPQTLQDDTDQDVENSNDASDILMDSENLELESNNCDTELHESETERKRKRVDDEEITVKKSRIASKLADVAIQ